MKKVILSLFSIVVCLSLFAQAPPQGINYQAVVYVPTGNQQVGVNSSGQHPANTKQVLVKFTLEEGNNGTVIYEETHTDTTDQYGLLNTVIGTGTPTSNSPGLFNQIDWSLGDPYLRVSITLTQYNSTVSSYQKLWSVPYALYAGHANTADFATNSVHADSSDYADMAGNGITGVTDNGDGTLTFTYYDGSSYTTGVLSSLVGATGPQGPAGQNGTNGQSAYDLWLAQGNTGTVADFLNSLQGPEGVQGNTGPQGIAGTNGLNGSNGQNTVVKTTTETAGTNCATGGVKIEYGLDANNNGTLDISEVNASLTKYVCNGASQEMGTEIIEYPITSGASQLDRAYLTFPGVSLPGDGSNIIFSSGLPSFGLIPFQASLGSTLSSMKFYASGTATGVINIGLYNAIILNGELVPGTLLHTISSTESAAISGIHIINNINYQFVAGESYKNVYFWAIMPVYSSGSLSTTYFLDLPSIGNSVTANNFPINILRYSTSSSTLPSYIGNNSASYDSFPMTIQWRYQ